MDMRIESYGREVVFENKSPADFFSSALNGHGVEQVLTMREYGVPAMFVIWGDIGDIWRAIRVSRVDYDYARVKVFELMAYAWFNNIPVWPLGEDPLEEALTIALQALKTDLMPALPKPVGSSRQAASLALLCDGIGIEKAKAVLAVHPFKDIFTLTVEDFQGIKGIGPKLAERLHKSIHGGKKCSNRSKHVGR
jgi:ERCC4-type nuclease